MNSESDFRQALSDPDRHDPATGPEWLVANGLGGFAAGTVRGAATRRYHGLLIAAFPPPRGRWMLLNHVSETVCLPDGSAFHLGTDERLGRRRPDAGLPPQFRAEFGLPIWWYDLGTALIERRVLMPHRRNTSLVTYRLLRGGPIRLSFRPLVHFRPQSDPVADFQGPVSYTAVDHGGGWEIHDGDDPVLRLRLDGARADFRHAPHVEQEVAYPEEAERGYHSTGQLWAPGTIDAELPAGGAVTLIASADEWDRVEALRPDDELRAELRRREQLLASADLTVRAGPAARLVLAADEFLITPPADGDDARSVIAGYYWFNEWGRDTMISLPGLTLVTGRPDDGRKLLLRYADFIHNGLIPDLIPEGGSRPRYNTADASLWFFSALHAYVEATGDRDTLRRLLPRLRGVVRHHLRGTDFNIRVDPADGLLAQGVPDLPLTWMDAKVGDWVVTPRRGKAVEINALWYNALKLLEAWLRDDGQNGDADEMAGHAAKARTSFNGRFWYAAGNYLYDVVDGDHGDDASVRPNQLFAIALPHPVLDEAKWRPVVGVVREKLLTPAGLRSLGPDDPDFQPRYDGDRRSRDAAYHQGTVWPWLIGPFIDAWLKVYPDDRAGARRFLDGLAAGELGRGAIGTVCEICDAETPYTPRGCVAQAWSVAEILRCLMRTAGQFPSSSSTADGRTGSTR
jgi:predicted glycogen debranching enzyme